ncbi:MAG: signal recognition particle subunit SRP19/SEC65 family protein [Thermoprotei archaeon]
MTKRDYIILWPSYFDLSKTRNSGRRLPKRYCVDKPSLGELEEAVKLLGLEVTVEKDHAYPRSWWESGRIIVKKNSNLKKSEILKLVASNLIKIRQKRSASKSS